VDRVKLKEILRTLVSLKAKLDDDDDDDDDDD
jgi:hypothetical protein